jgi:hypothetical protein
LRNVAVSIDAVHKDHRVGVSQLSMQNTEDTGVNAAEAVDKSAMYTTKGQAKEGRRHEASICISRAGGGVMTVGQRLAKSQSLRMSRLRSGYTA